MISYEIPLILSVGDGDHDGRFAFARGDCDSTDGYVFGWLPHWNVLTPWGWRGSSFS